MDRDLQVVLNSTHDALIVINKEGLVTIFNRAAEKILNIPAEEVLGRYVLDVIPTSQLIHVLKTGEAELNRQLEVGDIEIITNRVPVRDEQGNVVGAAAVFRDITEMIELARELTHEREIQSLLQAILNSTQDAISVVDQHGIGLYINPAYTRLTGLTEEQVIGKPATVDIAEGESVHYKVLKTRRPVHNATLKVGKDRKEVVVNVAPLIVEGQLKGSVAVIHDVSEIKQLTEALQRAKAIIRKLEAKYTFEDIVAVDPMMVAAVEKAKNAADTPATVILRGESGTGKELFAHSIHNASSRRFAQFIRVNCTALSESLLESELFGYEEGAFTGARKGGKKGLFEEAHGGTIFLDEIGDISLSTQAKLLRVLQEKEILRVGGTRPVTVDVRIIAATNANLEKLVEQKRFREDLYYRLNVIPIHIPPLRHHKQDIPLLCKYFVQRFNEEYGRGVQEIAQEALSSLSDYSWPGNIRELENCIGRAMMNMEYQDKRMEEKHLPLLTAMGPQTAAPGRQEPEGREKYERRVSLEEAVRSWEKEYIQSALAQNGGNRTLTAQELNISIRTLYYKIKEYNL